MNHALTVLSTVLLVIQMPSACLVLRLTSGILTLTLLQTVCLLVQLGHIKTTS